MASLVTVPIAGYVAADMKGDVFQSQKAPSSVGKLLPILKKEVITLSLPIPKAKLFMRMNLSITSFKNFIPPLKVVFNFMNSIMNQVFGLKPTHCFIRQKPPIGV